MKGVSRLIYSHDQNLVYGKNFNGIREFLLNNGRPAIDSFLEFTLSEASSEGGDAHLMACLWESRALVRHFPLTFQEEVLTLLVYPKFGEAKYEISRDNFLSNARSEHADPILVKNLPTHVKISIDSSTDAHYISNGKRGPSLPNRITSALFFKKALNVQNYNFLSDVFGVVN